jgi:hypothetical protein
MSALVTPLFTSASALNPNEPVNAEFVAEVGSTDFASEYTITFTYVNSVKTVIWRYTSAVLRDAALADFLASAATAGV